MRVEFLCERCGEPRRSLIRGTAAIEGVVASSDLIRHLAVKDVLGARRARECRVCGAIIRTVEMSEAQLGSLLELSYHDQSVRTPDETKAVAGSEERLIDVAVVAKAVGRSRRELLEWLRLFPRRPDDNWDSLSDREAAALGAVFIAAKGSSRRRKEKLLVEVAHRPPVDPDWAVVRRPGVGLVVVRAPRQFGRHDAWNHTDIWYAREFVDNMRRESTEP